MEPIVISHPLDWGSHYRLVFDYDPVQHVLFGQITGPTGSTGVVERHLATLIALNIAGQLCRLKLSRNSLPSLTMAIPEADNDFEIVIRLGGSEQREGELFGRYRLRDGKIETSEIVQKLTVFETRMLGNEKLYRWLPYPRDTLTPTYQRTDLHTHSSGQISARGLIEIALQHNIAYPTRLLDLLHITYPKDMLCMTTRFFFPPTDAGSVEPIPKEEEAIKLSALGDEGREKLRVAMAIPPDRQITFGDVEITVYRYRTPISKHPAVAYDLLLKTAQEYAKQGIVYAEITATSTSLLLPEYMRLLHETLPAIETATGVKLRFLAGLPRNLPSAMLEREIEKLKLMGASPYIVGIDFMGFEDNKISELEDYIQTIAAWAHEYDPEFTLRIHAGENRKNMTNVKESLHIAKKYRMRVRIGHAAHGLDDEAMVIAAELAREQLVMIEFNPDSNLALNNIDTVEELDMPKCISKGIPFVICSDGGGLYQTEARQLETVASFAASFAGVGHSVSKSVIQSEQDHLQREDARFDTKKQRLPADFLNEITASCKALPPLPKTSAAAHDNHNMFEQHLQKQGILFTPESIAAAIRGKAPLLILGATGKRYWNVIGATYKQQIQAAIDQMIWQLNPHKTYFLIGRPKDAGITSLLSRAVEKYNARCEEKDRFVLMSATVQADQTAHSFTPGLTHVLPLKGSLFTVPDQLVSYIAAARGHILFIGGGTFVRDAILIARDKNVSFALMRGPEGASTDKAVMMDPSRQFSDAAGLIANLRASYPDWFSTT